MLRPKVSNLAAENSDGLQWRHYMVKSPVTAVPNVLTETFLPVDYPKRNIILIHNTGVHDIDKYFGALTY